METFDGDLVSNRKRTPHSRIREYVFSEVGDFPHLIGARVAREFGISRQAANRHLARMVRNGDLDAQGLTRARQYSLRKEVVFHKRFDREGLSEHRVWTDHVRPLVEDLPPNVVEIVGHGLQEMVNNAIDHSEGQRVSIWVERGPGEIEIDVGDDGVGIFRKIQRDLGYADLHEVVLELSKGKLTTDPKRHTGEGIFFTSRAFDRFAISAGALFWATEVGRDDHSRDWVLEARKPAKGTMIAMRISPNSGRSLEALYDRFAGEGFAFSRTEVPILVATFGEESLVSRSSARRVLARLDRFQDVILDFEGVESIGQPFADEIFRVFANDHPEINMRPSQANQKVLKMIARARAHGGQAGDLADTTTAS